MKNENNIRLRPRFEHTLTNNLNHVRQQFINYKEQLPPGVQMKIRNQYIQLTFTGNKQHYWSPFLTLELEEQTLENKTTTLIRGLFGPSQTLWTFFIFLHFIVAGIFLISSMFAYSNYSLNKSCTPNLVIMALMTICWGLLYFIARQTRENGYPQMHELETLLHQIIKQKNT